VKPGRSVTVRATGGGACSGVVQWTAPHPEVPERSAPARVEFERDADARPRARRHDRVDQVEVRDIVDHECHARGQLLVGGEPREGRAIGRRVAEHNVVDAAVARAAPGCPRSCCPVARGLASHSASGSV